MMSARAELMPARSWVTVFEFVVISLFLFELLVRMVEVFKTYLRRGYSVQDADVVDVVVGVGGLLFKVFVAGDYLGKVDGGGDEGEPEEEASDDGCFGLHDCDGGNDRQ